MLLPLLCDLVLPVESCGAAEVAPPVPHGRPVNLFDAHQHGQAEAGNLNDDDLIATETEVLTLSDEPARSLNPAHRPHATPP